MAIFLSILSVACAIGAVVSVLRYDSKHFDLLVLSGVIFLSAAIPSFEVDASLEGAVAELVGIEGGVVSGVINLESSGVEASDWRPRHDEPYHEV